MDNDNLKPEVGMGATLCFHSDSKAFTIVSVSASGREITIQRDIAKRVDNNGMSESQEYEYERNPEGDIRVATLRKNGRYVLVGESMRGTSVVVGFRREYYDYLF